MPEITHINDLLPHIVGKKEIAILKRNGYQVIDYLFVNKDTFTGSPLLLECRGIKFDMDGYIIARPFHKFFNIGERQQPEDIDWNAGHHLTGKLDGSMIHSAVVKGHYRFMTRKGITDIANRVEEQFLRQYKEFLSVMNQVGHTCIFEYTAPDNRIVIRYEKPALTLLAARHMHSGKYMEPGMLTIVAKEHGVPIIDFTRGGPQSTPAQLALVRQAMGVEGVVIRFDDGHMLKLKADDYVMKHRVIDDMGSKKKVLALVFAKGVDDVIPILDNADALALMKFNGAVWLQVKGLVNGAWTLVQYHGHSCRKEFAEVVKDRVIPAFRGAAFATYDGKDPQPYIIKAMTKNPNLVHEKWRGE